MRIDFGYGTCTLCGGLGEVKGVTVGTVVLLRLHSVSVSEKRIQRLHVFVSVSEP